MSCQAISRPCLLVSAATFVIFVFLPACFAFPDQYELSSFLNNLPPTDQSYEAEFFSPRALSKTNSRAIKYDDESEDEMVRRARPASSSGVLKSQNRKFFAKTPAHDKHFRTILNQQEAATIKNPGQAAMVASDQAELRDRGLRGMSLQTSDDDVYEVESAPQMMRSMPYGGRGRGRERYRAMESNEAETPLELPVDVSFESSIDHSYEPKMQAYRPREYNQMTNEGAGHGSSSYSPRSYGRSMQSEEIQNLPLNFDVALANGDSPQSHSSYKKRPTRAHGQYLSHSPAGSSKRSSVQKAPQGLADKMPYGSVTQYYEMLPTSNSAPENDKYLSENSKPRRQYKSSSDEFRAPNYGPSPALHQKSTRAHERELFGSPPVANSPADAKHRHESPMESSWLDMGAYSSGKGAFGWYSDSPIKGNAANK